MSYLYGCSVQGIQKFIFESTRLQEIAGASELVEKVCSSLFPQMVERNNVKMRMLIQAAGNIRAVFSDRADLESIYRLFPKLVAEKVPGLALVQAVVEFQEPLRAEDVAALSEKLQGRIADPAVEVTSSVNLRAPRTGRGATCRLNGELLDSATIAKQKADSLHTLCGKFDTTENFPTQMEDVEDCGSYIAVIHADGNAMGKTLAALPAGNQYAENWKDFSCKLGNATQAAAQKAFKKYFAKDCRFRPVILGGDDLTVLCAASKAIDFTNEYLKAFENECDAQAPLKGLTACAGIAFVKSKFPFYYGVELAEKLCTASKQKAKKIAKDGHIPSCLMFMRELGSYVEPAYQAITGRTLQAGNVSFVFGPYATGNDAGLPTLDALRRGAEILRKYNPLHTGLRQWESELHLAGSSAEQLLMRLEAITAQKQKEMLREFKLALAELTGKMADASLCDLLTCDSRSPAADLLFYSKFMDVEESR